MSLEQSLKMGGWKLAQIKKLIDEELKEKFEYLIRSIERFVPMDTEKESRKRTGVELQTDSSKKLKSDTKKDVFVPTEKHKQSIKREEEFEIKKPILRYAKRKSLARKVLQKKPESTKSDTEEDVEAYLEERVEEPSSEEFPMGSIPRGPASAKIVKWQIIKTGKRGAYQIIREDHTDIVYVNFQGLLNDLTRDDLKELYRLMMLKYGNSRPEEEYERVLWGDLKTMFDPPSAEDAIWSFIHQQKLANKLYGYQLTISVFVKSWLVHKKTAWGKDISNPLIADDLLKIIWSSMYHGVNTPESDENSIKLYDLMYILSWMLSRIDASTYHEDNQGNLKFTSEDQVRGGLLGIIVNRLKSGSYRVKSGRHS
ncbi:hypothetical protein Tco_1018688 [Tanacetum coccineum]|uniref:Uncharacterized protein n=1 Tax=Tanacetum coccineum TaxID=301880 RepID=A0ABQ5FWG1_9ASTR